MNDMSFELEWRNYPGAELQRRSFPRGWQALVLLASLQRAHGGLVYRLAKIETLEASE